MFAQEWNSAIWCQHLCSAHYLGLPLHLLSIHLFCFGLISKIHCGFNSEKSKNLSKRSIWFIFIKFAFIHFENLPQNALLASPQLVSKWGRVYFPRELPLHLPSYKLFFQDEVDTLNERRAEVVSFWIWIDLWLQDVSNDLTSAWSSWGACSWNLVTMWWWNPDHMKKAHAVFLVFNLSSQPTDSSSPRQVCEDYSRVILSSFWVFSPETSDMADQSQTIPLCLSKFLDVWSIIKLFSCVIKVLGWFVT